MKKTFVNQLKWSERNTALDVIRIVAAFSVLSVHFFWNTDFYQQIIVKDDSTIVLAVAMRTFFMVCVPLFIMLTGYLMNRKELKLSYYKGILHVVGIYVIISIFCLIYKNTKGGQAITPLVGLQRILDFSADEYSWYIEMYFGLFLIIPFLNLIYNNLNTKQGKKILIFTFFVLATLPSICNVYGTKIVPAWWSGVWPLLYYFIGCYLKEYPLKLSWFWHLVLLAVAVFASTQFNIYRSLNNVFEGHLYNDWYGWQNVLSTTFLFSLLSRMKLEKLPVIVKGILYGISRLSLGIYLASWIVDQEVYQRLKMEVPNFKDRMPYFVTTVSRVFVGAFILALAAEVIYVILSKGITLIVGLFQEDKKAIGGNNKRKVSRK